MKFKSKLIRLIENHAYYKRCDEDTADKINKLFIDVIDKELKYIKKHKKPLSAYARRKYNFSINLLVRLKKSLGN